MGSDGLERDDDTGGESTVTDEGTGDDTGRRREGCGEKEKAKREYMERRRKRSSCRRIRHTKILSSSDANYLLPEQLSTASVKN